MLADMHLHSIYSDGWYTPEEICRRAVSHGVRLLSITDHDTLAGEEAKRAAAKRFGLAYVTGWEISAYLGKEKMHVLGYGCEIGEAYNAFMAERKKASFLRAEDSVNKLRAVGVPVTLEEVLAERSSGDLPVHTMHIARAAAKRLGIGESEAYLRYLAFGRPAQSNIGRPTPKEAIDCIHASGGIACLAHPGRITLPVEEKEAVIRRLVEEGLDGIEGVYTTHTKEETEYFLRLAEELCLYTTGGSDTHYEEETHRIGSPVFNPSGRLLERLKICI